MTFHPSCIFSAPSEMAPAAKTMLPFLPACPYHCITGQTQGIQGKHGELKGLLLKEGAL